MQLPRADASYVLLCAVATLAFAGFAWSSHRDGEQQLRWPKVNGTIGRASAERYFLGYRPHLEYAYVAAGQRRVGSDVFRPAWFLTKDPLDGFTARHPIGEPVEVHVDPSDPRRSWASAGPAYTAWWPLASALGVFFAAVSLLFTVAFGNAYRARRRALARGR